MPNIMSKSWLFCFALVFVTRCIVVSLAIPKSNLTDLSALLAFKAHVSIDPSNVMGNNWSTVTSFCRWFGVTCSARHYRVTALDLSHMNLGGTIPPQVGNLSFLVSINLSNNSFHGDLPNELANLHRLKFMNLGDNSFGGGIPSRFGILPELQHLVLANNSLTGTIPSSLFNITTLESMIFEGNFLEGNISDEIGYLSKLKELRLGQNQFSGMVPRIIFNMTSLQHVSLIYNKLSGSLQQDLCSYQSKLYFLALGWNQLIGQIPSDLYKCKELQVVGLNDNKFTGEIPREIGNMTKLWWLSLSDTNVAGTLPLEIDGLQNLEILDLSTTSVSGPIPLAIFNLSMARVISMFENYLSGHLPSSVHLRLPNLLELNLAINKLSGPIPDYICNASQLMILDFFENSLSGFIPDSLGNLRNLQWLNFGSNFLTSKYLSPELNIFSSLANCKNLIRLGLDNNQLDMDLPISIGNLSASLQYLYAGNSKIKGRIPAEIGNLSNLVELNIGYNDLMGTIPSTIGRLQDLQGVFLEVNKLQGHIPFELCHLEKLVLLHFMENELSGSIPKCLNNLTSMRELYLDSNRFASSIPPTLWQLNHILFVNLSSNSLSGSLPSDIKNLKVVVAMDLSSNQLSGEMPNNIGGLRDLTYLSLHGNKLAGHIPQSFGDLVSLEFMDLSRNNLSGVIPKSFEKLLHLKYFNVSFNHLQGEIPSGGPFVNLSIQSFIGNGALCGSTRMHLPPCKGGTPRSSKTPSKFVFRYILPIVGPMLLVLALVAIFVRYRKWNAKLPTQRDLLPLAIWRRISYQELELSTNKFDESNLLGAGSFGSVYIGTLSDGMSIAVKVFNLQLEGAFDSFDIECEVLRNLRHRNLVKIISSCSNLDFKALVLQFMPNWSLEKWLYSHNYFLDILQRLNIVIDVASALEYLHHSYSTPVVHCDLKPSNILLDEDMVAHVADFGIAKLLGGGDSMTQTMTLATIGYMAPEYGSEGIVSVRGDVYSYGILLMETFTRKKPTDEIFVGEMSLKFWVKQSFPNAITEVVDTNLLRGEEHFVAKKDCITSILELALQCSADLPQERLNIKDVLAALKKIKSKFQKAVGRQSRHHRRV